MAQMCSWSALGRMTRVPAKLTQPLKCSGAPGCSALTPGDRDGNTMDDKHPRHPEPRSLRAQNKCMRGSQTKTSRCAVKPVFEDTVARGRNDATSKTNSLVSKDSNHACRRHSAQSVGAVHNRSSPQTIALWHSCQLKNCRPHAAACTRQAHGSPDLPAANTISRRNHVLPGEQLCLAP